jgi:hypothetical protein
MKLKENATELIARVQPIRPEPDGWGAIVTLEVMQNLTQDPLEDFLRPDVGSVLEAFTADPESLDALEEGSLVRAHASLQGGPFGERTVLRTVSQV